ncbi:MAG: hypothetical protein RL346_975 [Verrucomicrobiota bacterium]
MGDDAIRVAGIVLGDVVVIPRQFDHRTRFERFDDPDVSGIDLGVALVVLDQDLEFLLPGIAVLPQFLVGKVFGDFEHSDFSRMSATIRAKAGAAHTTLILEFDKLRHRGMAGEQFALWEIEFFLDGLPPLPGSDIRTMALRIHDAEFFAQGVGPFIRTDIRAVTVGVGDGMDAFDILRPWFPIIRTGEG